MIRTLKEEDLDQIVAIEQQCFPNDPWKREQFLYELHENPFCRFLVLEEEEILGYLDLWITYEMAQIADLAVRKDMQRTGCASKLMQEAVRLAVESGCENLSLEVRDSNSAAIALYEKNGFVQAAMRRHYYEDGEDARLMIKPIGGLEYDDDTGDRNEL